MSVFLRCLLAIMLLFNRTFAQQNSTPDNSTSKCTGYDQYGPNGDTYNASASYQVAGFYPPGNGTRTPANWTYNTAILAVSNSSNLQTLWIDTLDGTDVGSKDLPYFGCMTAFFGIPQSTNKRGQDDNGDCTKAYDQDCAKEMISFAKSATLPLSGTIQDANDMCARLGRMTVPDACRKYVDRDTWGSAVSSANIGNSTFTNGTDGRGCSSKDEKGANKGSITWGLSSSGDDNQTAYDRALTSITPVLSVAWLKGNKTDNPFALGWSDARFVCMRASQIKAGSAAPKGVPSLGARTMADGLSKSAPLAAMMIVALTFCLS